MHLAGFVIRIYHDSRSPERQIANNVCIYELVYVCHFVNSYKVLSYSSLLGSAVNVTVLK